MLSQSPSKVTVLELWWFLLGGLKNPICFHSWQNITGETCNEIMLLHETIKGLAYLPCSNLSKKRLYVIVLYCPSQPKVLWLHLLVVRLLQSLSQYLILLVAPLGIKRWSWFLLPWAAACATVNWKGRVRNSFLCFAPLFLWLGLLLFYLSLALWCCKVQKQHSLSES